LTAPGPKSGPTVQSLVFKEFFVNIFMPPIVSHSP
jgi:hypothetical protein